MATKKASAKTTESVLIEAQPTAPVIAINEYIRNVTLGETEYTLDFSFRALANAEREFLRQGIFVNLLFALEVTTLNLNRMQDLFAAAVRTHHPDLGYQGAVALVQTENIYDIANCAFDVLRVKAERREKKAAA